MQRKEQGFLNILLTGKVSEDNKSKYAETYRFFQNKIFRLTVAQCFDLPAIVLYKCFFLNMKVASQEEGVDILNAINEMDALSAKADSTGSRLESG